MRILITTGIFPPEIGGPATYVPIIASTLSERGHRVCVIAPEEKGMDCPILDPPYQIIRFPHARFLRFVNYFIELWRAFSIILKHVNDYEIIYINGLNLAATLVCLLKRKPSIVKVVGDGAWEFAYNRGWTSLNLDEFQTAKGWRFEILRLMSHTAAKRANTVIVPSHYLARIVNTWRISKSRIKVICNAISIDCGNNEIFLPEGFSEGFRLLMVGRMIPLKRIEQVIDILPTLDGAKLVIVGAGPLFTDLNNQVKRLRLFARVYFTGPISHKEVWSLLKYYANVLIINSVHETSPHVILEAMNFGVPVVATAVGGIPELIQDRNTGILIQPDSPQQLIDALHLLQTEIQLRKTLSEDARRFVKRFSIECMVNETESALFKAIR